MHGSKELDTLLKNGYDPAVADGIRGLERMLDENAELASELDALTEAFANRQEIPLGDALAGVKKISEKYGANEYSLDLLLIINGLPHMHKRFTDNGYPDSVFYETMDDIRCKVNECVECKGVVGTFVAGWYDRFFVPSCFGLGRFQYEVAVYGGDDFVMRSGKTLKKGDKYINMHIPSRGIPLTDDVRLASYRAAYPYFKRYFDDGIVIFGCHSWLLFPKHLEFLPPHLNIRKFIGDFELTGCEETEEFGDIWRVFGRYADLPYDKLPRDTALRKAYAEWLCSGHKTGYGSGVFEFDGEKIL